MHPAYLKSEQTSEFKQNNTREFRNVQKGKETHGVKPVL